MKTIILISILTLVSCAQKVSPSPTNLAADSIAFGKVSAVASKNIVSQDVCFDIKLQMQEVTQKEISSSNWTVAWVDHESRYHLLVLTQRNPASVPEVTSNGWTNNFVTCAPAERLGNVGSLVLTPKTLPFPASEGLKLEWNN